jgi:hypothetical protein
MLDVRVLILLVIGLGFANYIRIANQNKSEKIDGFFLGGRNISSSLFENATWGTSFAFNNGIYWGIFFGYTAGLSALWINGAWALGFVALSLLIPKLLEPTERFTLHGFLGDRYSGHARVMASIASSTVMLFNIGAEIVFAAFFLSKILGIENLEVILIGFIAFFSAVYCSIGGYRANAAIDRLQNPISVLCLLTILFLICTTGLNNIDQPYLLFLFFIAIISVILLGANMIWRAQFVGRFENVFLLLAVIACIMIGIETGRLPVFESLGATLESLGSTGTNGASYVGSLVLFQFAYQFVDTSNWQNISARRISLAEHTPARPIARALREAAGKIFLAPIMITTFVGIAFHSVKPGAESSDATFMVELINRVQPFSDPLISGLLLGAIAFALIGSSRSGIDSWVMAAAQTLSWDVIDYRNFHRHGFSVSHFSDDEQQQVTRRSKALLFALTGVGSALYYILYVATGGKIVLLFSVIFSSSLALLPSLAFALIHTSKHFGHRTSRVAVASMFAGYATPLVLLVATLFEDPFTISSFSVSRDEMYTLAPYLAIGMSTMVFVLGRLLYRDAGGGLRDTRAIPTDQV